MLSGLVARNGGRAGLAALVAILALGLGLRVGEAWDGREPVYDAAAYAAIAANLEQGQGFTVGAGTTQRSSNYSPGLPLVVAGVYEVSGGVHERLARVLLALVGALAVLFAYLIGRRLGGVVAGLIGAGVVAIYPALLEYQGMLMSEPLAATLLSGAVLAMFWAKGSRQKPLASGSCHGDERGALRDGVSLAPLSSPRHPLVRWLLPGLLLGALALVRPEYLAIGVVLAVVVFGTELRGRPFRRIPKERTTALRSETRDGWRRALSVAAVLVAGLAVVVVPWTVRNVVALDRAVPISTGGGQVLYAGTYLPSDGDPEKVGAEVVARNPDLFVPADAERLRLEQILARLAAREHPDLETDQALSRMGREQLWDDVSEAPLEYAGFVAAKVGRIWSHGPRAVMREPGWEALHWALLGLGLLGLAVLLWRRRWEALVIATVFGSITLISALLVASPRRVLVLVPLLAALAGAGAVWLWGEVVRLRQGGEPGRGAASPG